MHYIKNNDNCFLIFLHDSDEIKNRLSPKIEEFSKKYGVFRNKIIDLSNIFYSVDKTSKTDYEKLFFSLIELQDIFVNYLKNSSSENNFKKVRKKRKEIFNSGELVFGMKKHIQRHL